MASGYRTKTYEVVVEDHQDTLGLILVPLNGSRELLAWCGIRTVEASRERDSREEVLEDHSLSVVGTLA